MDLGKLDIVSASEKGAFCHLTYIDGTALNDEKTGEPIGFIVYGKDSKRFRVKENQLKDVLIARQRKNQPASSAMMEERAIELLSHVIEPVNVVINGAALANKPSDIAEVLKAYPWIKEQVDEFAADRANFLTKGEKP